MSDEPDGGGHFLFTPAEWCWVVGTLIVLAILLVGGCRSGWLAPAQLPVPPP